MKKLEFTPAAYPWPVHQPSASSPASVAQSDTTARPQTAARGARRVLVVDDEPTIRSSLARYLRRLGWDADVAEDGTAALRKLRRSAPDRYQAMVSDLRMPGCSGVELHDWLAEHRPQLFSRLIITTGDLASPAWKEFIARTSRPMIEKPFELSALGALIESMARDE